MVRERGIGAAGARGERQRAAGRHRDDPELQAYTVRRTEELAGRLVAVLEDPNETDARLGEVLAALAAKMEPKEAAAVAGRGAWRLAGLLEDLKETDADPPSLGRALGALSLKIPVARQTQLLALSHLLLRQTQEGRKLVIRLCELLALPVTRPG